MNATNISNIVAVESSSAHTGAIVMWALQGEISVSKFKTAWEQAGGNEADLPADPTPAKALRRAVRGLGDAHRLVRPVGGGFALVDEAEVDAELSYATKAKAKVVGRTVEVETNDPGLAVQVEAKFQSALETIGATDCSMWLVRLLEKFDAVPLRSQGGVYFVPPTTLPKVEMVDRVLRNISEHKVFFVPAMRTDSAVEAILAAVESEAQEAVRLVEADIADKKFSTARGWRGRERKVDAVESKVARYEALLGQKLDSLRDKLTSVRAAVAAEILTAEATSSGSVENLLDL
jgi:hypothetical protein